LINAKVPGAYFPVDDGGYFDDLMNGKIKTPLDPDTALFYTEPDGLTVRRVARGAEDALPPQAAWDEHSTLRWVWNLAGNSEVLSRLASPDPRVVEKVVRILTDAEDGKRNFLLFEALKGVEGLDSAGSASAPTYAALSTPALTANLLRHAPPASGQSQMELALAAIEASGDARVVVEAVLDVARRIDPPSGRVLAANVAVRAAPGGDAERESLLIIAKENPKFDARKASSALDHERKARVFARDIRTAADAMRSFDAAQADWAGAGLQRDDLFHPIAFCRVAYLDDAGLQEILRDWTAHDWAWNVRYLNGYLGSRSRESVSGITFRGVTADPSARPTAGGTIDLQAVIQNRSDLHVPGGPTPISGRVTWSWTNGDGRNLAPGEQWMSPDGLPAGESRRRPLVVRVPEVTGKWDLQVSFVAFGKTCAAAAPLSFTIGEHPATAGSAPASR
jgi:hypothetical protein